MPPAPARLTLVPGRESALLRRHPWVFRGAIRELTGVPSLGETVEIRAHDGRWLAWGSYSPQSQIAARVWSFERDTTVDAAFLRARVRASIARRETLLAGAEGAERLIFGESDGLPGLIVDRYADQLVVQILAAGAERWREDLVEALVEALPDARIYERSDAAVRGKEGLPPRVGALIGEVPAEPVPFREGQARFRADVRAGHKTGFYLDQRASRDWVLRQAAGCDVLNVFSYTGSFAVMAGLGGASGWTQVDSSADALAAAALHLRENALPCEEERFLRGDAFEVLRSLGEQGRAYDLVILDPPKFIDSKAQLAKGTRGYKDINRVAFRLLRPGGRLLTFSCSGLLDAGLFQKIVADAALDAGREARITERLFQGPDHPTLLSFPEASYLKGLALRVE